MAIPRVKYSTFAAEAPPMHQATNTESADVHTVEFKERLKAAQEDADRFPENAKLQGDYLKLLNMVDSIEVIRRIKGGQYAMNEVTRKEFMKALLKTGEFESFPIDSVLLKAAEKREQGSSAKNPLYVATIGGSWSTWLSLLITLIVGGVIIYSFLGRGGVAEGMLSKSSMLNPVTRSTTTFSDVKGAEEAKEELEDIVEYLKNPHKFARLNARLPRGILLTGPPGCGKTLVARALAGEAGVPFFFASGSEFEEMFVGVGASRVRKLFEKAKQMAPCVIFIDEIDAIGGRRDSPDSRYHKMTLNQLLVELDGFEQHSGIVVIAATNMPETLDPAVTRPGRFDRKVMMTLPDIKARREILKMYLAGRAAPDVSLDNFAKSTSGFSGADINNMVNIAAIDATKKNLSKITSQLMESAKDHVLMGPARKSLSQTQNNLKNTAFHESGHAIVRLHTTGSDQLVKATLVPRGEALGFVEWAPDDELSTTKQEMMDAIDTALGGRAAEEVVFGPDKITSGAGNDLVKATNMAMMMTMTLGMGEQMGKVVTHPKYNRNYEMSDQTKRLLEQEVKEILEQGYKRAKGIITKNRRELDLLANALLEYETLTREEILLVIQGKDIKDHVDQRNKRELELTLKDQELYGLSEEELGVAGDVELAQKGLQDPESPKEDKQVLLKK